MGILLQGRETLLDFGLSTEHIFKRNATPVNSFDNQFRVTPPTWMIGTNDNSGGN